jgi:hypothetical protein
MPVTKKKPATAENTKKAPDKMLLFAAEYVIDFNGTRAYKEVYGKQLSDNTAAVNASKLLRHTKVCSETERLLAEVKNRRNERKLRVIQDIEAIAYDKTLEPKDRLKGLELLGKTEALFTEKVEHSGAITIAATPTDENL